MKKIVFLIALLVVGAGIFTAWSVATAKEPASAASMDPLTVGSDNYKLVMENERIRLLQVTFEPGDKVALHSHPDHAAYVLEGGMITITNSEGKTQEITAKPGDTFWIPAESHSAVNPGKTRISILVIELKEPAPGKSGEAHGSH
jgi:quercetin dioxygenase-like cupin family protein